MIYLDTGCLVKLYYPEPDSAKLAGLIQGKPLWYTPLHELEFTNALSLKIFFKGASVAQVSAARALVALDINSGTLISSNSDWNRIFPEACQLAERHTPTVGCRSLDILHCAAAKVLGAVEFVSSDGRQKKLAAAMGLNLGAF